MGREQRRNQQIRDKHLMKVSVTLKPVNEGSACETRTYNNVKDFGISNPGIYVFMNADSMVIASIPLHNIMYVEVPEHDTSISLIHGLST